MRYTLSLILAELDFLKSEEQAIQEKIKKFDFDTLKEYNFFTSKLKEIQVIIEELNTDLLFLYNFTNDKQFKHFLKNGKNEKK